MGSRQCDGCGKRFSRHNFELHKKLRDCGTEEENSSESSPAERTRNIKDGDEISAVEGTVSHYDDDGGFGFLTTVDLEGQLVDDSAQTQDVFFHISDVDASWIDEGDRFRCDVIKGDRSLKCKNIEIIIRDGERDSYEKPADDSTATGFGHQKDDTQYGVGRKSSATESDIESFKDDRKFR